MYLFFFNIQVFNNFRLKRILFLFYTCHFRSKKMGNRYNRKNLHISGLNKNSEYEI